MAKKSKFKIPTRLGNRTRTLEKEYKKALIQMLQDLYPEEGFTFNSFFQRITVNDLINPLTHKKEYGISFICDKTVICVAEAYHELDNSVKALCLEGLAAGMNQCDDVKSGFKQFDYKDLKGIIFEREPQKLEDDYCYVSQEIEKEEPFIFQLNEYRDFLKIFESTENGLFPIRIFNSESNPKASECFEESKRLLALIPNRRVPRI